MAFFHQLRLLLWKNYTLKKRAPYILCLELIVPLVLFLILVSIRNHRHPYKRFEESWYPEALPSAGLVPLLQSFCSSGSTVDKNGYKVYPNASITTILSDVADISNTPVFNAVLDIRRLQNDFEVFSKDERFSKQPREIQNFNFADVFINRKLVKQFLIQNLSMPSNMATSLMEASLNGSEISQVLLEKNSNLFDKYVHDIEYNGIPNSKLLNELQKGVVFQTLFDPTSFSDGPTWLRMLFLFGQVPAVFQNGTERNELKQFFVRKYMSPDELHNLSCREDVFDQLVILRNDTTDTTKRELQQFLCGLNETQTIRLADELKSNFNWSTFIEKMHVTGPTIKEFNQRMNKIRHDLTTVENLQDAILKLTKLANDLQLNLTNIDKRKNETKPKVVQQNANDMWQVLSPVLCGVKHERKVGSRLVSRDNTVQELLEGKGSSTHALKIMLYMLTSDPMILYSPNGTEADTVMKKSGHFLELIKTTKDMGNKWLDLSKEFQDFLRRNDTQTLLKNILISIDTYPLLYDKYLNIDYNLYMQSPEKLRYFLKNNHATFATYFNLTREHFKYIIQKLIIDDNGKSELLTQLHAVDYMAKGWEAVLKPMKLDIFYGFPNETAMLNFISNMTAPSRTHKPVLSAVVFDNIEKDGKLPKHIHYRIRMDGRLLPSTQKVRSSYWYPGPLDGNSQYLSFGFAWMQDQLERAMIEVLTHKNITAPGLYTQMMPYPCYLKDNFMFVIQYIMPLCVVVSFIYSVAILVQSIVSEKEQRLKEVMKMMGLSNAVHWMAWFITSATTLMMIVILLTIILKTGGILQYSNPAIVLLFLTLAAMATTNFCFLISIFFSKAKLAAACGGIIYFVTYMPYVFISIQEGGSSHMEISATVKTLASLLSTTAFGLGARYFALFEQNGEGVQWNNISSSPLQNDGFNLAQVFTMLIVDTILYAILVWYIEAIHPGTYGIPRPWYFPLQISYWLGDYQRRCELDCFKPYKRVNRERSVCADDPPNTPALLAVERDPIHLKLGVSIDNLFKVYKKGSRPAVDHLSLNLYEGQITSFLGHNGAGKTTTMSLLTGLFPSTSGTAYIYGDDIHTDMNKIRTSLGLCPQHNVLYGKLTVEEHLWFYARLKGMPEKQVFHETDRILEDIGLPEKRNSPVNTLSGGMKRKLSVAMAFVGGSRTVILDEPTAGVDPYARRAIWELLAKYKHGRTILLSTHFMDEADILGDRIAIISHGKLRCCGSSLFLKTKFGDGYHLTIVKDTNKEKDATSSVSVEAITKFIKGYIPSAELICKSRYELSYILPDKGKERKSTLKQLFEDLEKQKENLHCKSYGLQDTTLEEVFLKVTEATVVGEGDAVNDLTTDVNSLTTDVDDSSIETNTSIQMENITTTPVFSSPVSTSTGSSLDTTPVKSLLTTERRKFGHRRSLSHDIAESMLALARRQKPPVCVHRRTPSGGFSGHRRALSSDLTFVLTHSDTNTPETIKKVSKHKRIPSGVTKVQALGSETWEMHAGETTVVNSNIQKWQQFYGLLLKRFHHSRRNLKALLTHILLPGIFVSIAMTVALSQPTIDTYPPLVLSPSMFHPAPYYIPFSNNNRTADSLSVKMENTLVLPSGIGSDCVLRTSAKLPNFYTLSLLRRNLSGYFDDSCLERVNKAGDITSFKKHDINKGNGAKGRLLNLTCRCVGENMEYRCDKGIDNHVNMFTTVTMDTMVNVSNEDISSYLLHTNFLYKRNRYGGITFGDLQNVVPEKIQESSLPDVKNLYVRDTARVWFSNKGFHSMPTFINAMDNAILRASITPDMGDPSEYGITAINHPLNFTRNVLNLDAIKQGTDAIIAIFVIIAMSFVPASFVVFLVMERTTKAKHIQFVSGVNPVLYWLSNYVWDMLNFMIPAMACMVIFHVFNVPAYSSRTNFPAVCALFICYGWAITPMMYPASFAFHEASTAYVVLILLNLFLGITCTVTTSILQLFPNDPQLRVAFEVVRIGSLMFPNYCLGRGLMDLAYNELMNMFYVQIGQFHEIRSPFEWDIVLRSCVCMVSEGVVFFVITLIIEYKSSIKRRTVTVMDNSIDGDDIDVGHERNRVLSGGAEEDLLRIENLTKIYNSKKTGKHLAVNRLTVGVAKGECFGLLGVNGAGKTTTFKMLTGDSNITAGDAYVDNKSVARDLLDVHKMIGYCPQFDALIDHLTAEEHLYFYARLKGIPELEIKNVVNWLIKKMALTRYANKTSKTYSGGNKRKLSAAIALIGNPKVIFMDEPTTGMDPGARRFLWNIILSIIKQGTRSVVLTSHSMEECEALCTKLAIMVNGQFQCLGSTQHIKDRFGDGYIVTMRVKGNQPDMVPIMNFMKDNFYRCLLKESHHNSIQYQLRSSDDVSLASIFNKMETACRELDIEDYSVSQTTLDNVFVNFAKHQTDATLQNDPSFVYAKHKPRIKALQSRLRNLMTSFQTNKRRRGTLTHLLQLPNEQEEETGNIGENEEEVGLNDIEAYLFPRNRSSLTFNL